MRTNHQTLAAFTCLLWLVGGTIAADEPAAGRSTPDDWKDLFDGRTLQGWQLIKKAEFAEHGPVEVKDSTLWLHAGKPATGVRWSGEFPKWDYEVELECQRASGHDFFCGLTFPVGQGSLSLVLGGWGGRVVGFSCLDGVYAFENETMAVVKFEPETWYHVRLRVSEAVVRVWIDAEATTELEPAQFKLTVSEEMRPTLPFGIATWKTTGALRKIRYRQAPAKATSAPRS